MKRARPSSEAGRFREAARKHPQSLHSDRVEDRAVGALVGTFVGDALGMPYEGAPVGLIPDVLEMEDARLGRGTYTDDTQMMIALAESLLRCDFVDPEDLARTFRAHYDPRRGYGAGTSRVINLWEQGEPVERAALQLFGGTGSLGNGAAMRVAPVAVRLAEDEALLATQARRSARVTHAHPLAIDGAVVQAVAVAAALEGDEPLPSAVAAARTKQVREGLIALQEVCASALSAERLNAGGRAIGSSALESVPVAIVAAALAKSFEEAVTVAIGCGGDTDTLGAMAGAIAGARFGARAIPERWLEALEDGDCGRRHVEGLAIALSRRARGAMSMPLGGVLPVDG